MLYTVNEIGRKPVNMLTQEQCQVSWHNCHAATSKNPNSFSGHLLDVSEHLYNTPVIKNVAMEMNKCFSVFGDVGPPCSPGLTQNLCSHQTR
jgi:hypothetical protein